MDVEAGLQRKVDANTAGEGEWNRMDRLELDFHQRVRHGYLDMAHTEPERWLVVSAAASVEKIKRVICTRLEEVISGTVGVRPQQPG